MPLRLRLRIPRLANRLDARELVAKVGDAIRDELANALLKGYSPETGAPRDRNRQGKPVGVGSGKLANGLRRTPVEGGKRRATTTVVPPEDRAEWVAKRGDVMVASGTAAKAAESAADEYVEKVT